MNTKKSLSIFVFIISGLLPSFVVTEALCEDWVLFSTFKNGNILYYDSDDVSRNSANIAKVRTKIEYSKRGLKEEKSIMIEEGISEAEMIRRGYDRLCHTVILWKMQCQDNMSCMLTFTDYDRSGKIMISHNLPANESCDPITPESPEVRSIFEMLCNKQTAMK
jgi:hypothetical protein